MLLGGKDLDVLIKGKHVFSYEAGEGFASLRRSLETAVRKSEIADFRFHDLRYTFASNLVTEGQISCRLRN